jgi:DNA-binding CsgD family transcriptional regulator/tetratricopeptide (TPR) repeat protein
MPFSTPIVSPVLVGRAAHVASLRQCVDELAGGTGTTVLIAGEAGIGKSRLLAETVADAESRGIRVLIGHCFEPDRALPYAPILDLMRTFLVRWPAEAEEALREIAPELLGSMPELGRRFPGMAPAPSLGPEQDQRRLLHALTGLFAALAASGPLLVAFEDVHWCDEASLDILLHLARRVRGGCPVVLIATLRSDEIHPTLAPTLTALVRERLAAELRLMPLTANDVATMLQFLGDRVGPLPADVRAAIYRISEGNPFVVEELLRAILTSEDGGVRRTSEGAEIRLPPSAKDAVRRRVARVSPGARSTLTLAAVCGQRFDFPLLEALSGCDGADLLDQMKELIGAQLVVEESVDRFAFRHALTREAITSDLLGRERRELHRRVAEAMSRIVGDDPDRSAAELAFHWYQSGAWAEAYDCARRVGERALVLYTPRSAIEHFTRAIDAAIRLGRAAEPAVYRGRGAAFDTLGDFEAARADDEIAVAVARSAGDPGEEVEALLALGLLWASHDYAKTADYLQSAMDLARQTGDSAALARSLNRRGNWLANMVRPSAAVRDHREALAIFEGLGDKRGVAQTLDLLGMAHSLGGDQFASAAAYRRAIPLLREVGDRQTLVNSLNMLSRGSGSFPRRMMERIPVSPEEGDRMGEEAIETAREIGWRAGEAFALSATAVSISDWRPGRALARARAGLQIAEEIGHRQWQVFGRMTLGELMMVLHDLPAAKRHLEIALASAREIGSGFLAQLTHADLGSVLVLEGDLDRAETTLTAALDADAPAETFGERAIWCARADLAFARSDYRHVLAILDRLSATAKGGAGDEVERMPYLACLRGEALAAMGQAAEAEAVLGAVVATAAAGRLLPLRWRAHFDLGALARTQGRRENAEREHAAGWAAVDAFAVEVDDEAVRASFLHDATARFPRVRPPSARKLAKDAAGGLTARERQVAVLVSKGLTNREIADALFVSHDTARTHLTNIYGKLGLDSRAQLAVWVKEHGPVSPEPVDQD